MDVGKPTSGGNDYQYSQDPAKIEDQDLNDNGDF